MSVGAGNATSVELDTVLQHGAVVGTTSENCIEMVRETLFSKA